MVRQVKLLISGAVLALALGCHIGNGVQDAYAEQVETPKFSVQLEAAKMSSQVFKGLEVVSEDDSKLTEEQRQAALIARAGAIRAISVFLYLGMSEDAQKMSETIAQRILESVLAQMRQRAEAGAPDGHGK